jgi:phosphoglycerol transferase MdoB-like AlkP superfamily enzyme
MVGLTPAELMALPPEYLMEVNPIARRMYNTGIAFVVVDTIMFLLFIVSTRMARQPAPLELYFLMPVGYLAVVGIALAGICKFITIP